MLTPSNVVFCVAVELELPHLSDEEQGSNFLITDMGKIFATGSLVEYLLDSDEDVKLVVNLGSAGSKKLPSGLYLVDRCSAWDENIPDLPTAQPRRRIIEWQSPYKLPWQRVHCATGDSFVENQDVDADIFDMECYALAHVCQTYNIPFISVKYVSDAGDYEEWFDSLPLVREYLTHAYKHIINVLDIKEL